MENFDQTVQDNLWRQKETTSDESSQLQTLETVVNQEIQSLLTSSIPMKTICSHTVNPMSIIVSVHGVPACAILDLGFEISLVNMGLLKEDQLPWGIILGINALQFVKIKLDFGRKIIYWEENGQR